MMKCSKCRIDKLPTDFYSSKGITRSQCKHCVIRANVRYQQANSTWLDRDTDPDARKAYMREYYKKNPEKYVEYRMRFAAKHPEYHKLRKRKLKERD